MGADRWRGWGVNGAACDPVGQGTRHPSLVSLGGTLRLGLPRPELRMDDGERHTPSAAAGGAGISSPGVSAGRYITDHQGWCRGSGQPIEQNSQAEAPSRKYVSIGEGDPLLGALDRLVKIPDVDTGCRCLQRATAIHVGLSPGDGLGG